ncbi:efflux RND transporter periplasmic adaptor subunit [Candidatus Binatus sp.]|uniref:efflux RND transporter periplasmic adaptor subunit n=1 Tax=Candidatus Binatus sp. TaxID=2811406 RepID=UPI003BB1B469
MKLKSFRVSALVVLAAALGAFALAGCHQPAAAEVDTKTGPAPIAIAVAAAHQQSLDRTAEVQGALFPREHAVMSSEVEGRVTEVVADFGDKVAAGQVMLKINPREYELRVETAQASLDQARAKLANSTARYNRARTLKESESISAEQFDQTASQMRVDQADTESADEALAMARKKLGDTEIKAPFSGSVQKRMVSLGEYVAPGKEIYELIATDPIKLRCPMPERFVPLARVGMSVKLAIDADQGTSYTGKITRIAPALDESSRTLLIEAEVANPDGALKPGFFAHVTMDLGHDSALFVPTAAVLRYAGVARVFIVEQGVVRAREVTTGSVVGDQTEITGGLKEGDHVAVSDVDRLADGTAVVAKEQS